MSELTPNPEGKRIELATLAADIEKLRNRVEEARRESDPLAEEEAQGQLNKAKYRRYEVSDERERGILISDCVQENASSYKELAEVGVPIGVEQILFDAFGESVEITAEQKEKLYETLSQYEWWRESEHYDE